MSSSEANTLPSRNIEIKARLSAEGRFEELVERARKLTGTNGQLFYQHDVYYKVAEGRLKLRFLQVYIFIDNFIWLWQIN